MKTTATIEALRILNNGNLTTAHQIARITGYTPQYINRCLKRLFADGRVAYTIREHRGNAKQKRLWCTLEHLHCWEYVYPFVTPEYRQERLI